MTSVQRPGSNAPSQTTSTDAPTAQGKGAGATAGADYHIKKGDTLSHIALAAYGTANMWQVIKAFNEGKVKGADTIFADGTGSTLKLPTKEQAQALMAQLGLKPWTPPGGNARTGGGQRSASPGAGAAGAANSVGAARGAGAVQGAAATSKIPALNTMIAGVPDLDTGVMKTSAGSTTRSIAAAAFGIRKEDVAAIHLEAMAEGNPALNFENLDKPLAADAIIYMGNSPLLAKSRQAERHHQRKQLEAIFAQDAAAPAGGAAKLGAEERTAREADLKALMADIEKGDAEVKALDFIGGFGVMQAKTQADTSVEGIQKSYGEWIERAKTDAPKLVPTLQKNLLAAHQAAIESNDASTKPALAFAHLAATKALLGTMIAAEPDELGKADLLGARANILLREAGMQSSSPTLYAYATRTPPPAPVSAKSPLPADIAAAVTAAEQNIVRLTAEASADLKAVAAAGEKAITTETDPEQKKLLTTSYLEGTKSQLRAMPSAIEQAKGAVYASANDWSRGLRTIEAELALSLKLDPKTELLKPSVTRTLNDDGSETKLSMLFGTTVHELSAAQIKTVCDKITALKPEERAAAVQIIARYSQSAGDHGFSSGVSVASQLLQEEAKRNPVFLGESLLALASQAKTIGNIRQARTHTEAARQGADVAKGTDEQKALFARAVIAEAAIGETVAQGGEATLANGMNEKEEAAVRLTALRKGLEEAAAKLATGAPVVASSSAASAAAAPAKPASAASGAVHIKTVPGKELIAQVNLSEFRALLFSGQAREAEASLDNLKEKYADVLGIKEEIANIEKEYRQGGWAGVKSILIQGTNNSGKDIAFAVASGAALGAAFGSIIPVFGTVAGGVASGALSGFGALWAMTAARSVSKGQIGGSFSTGLSSVTNTDAMIGGAATIGSLVGLGTPFAMMRAGRVGWLAQRVGGRVSTFAPLGRSSVAELEKVNPSLFKGAVTQQDKVRIATSHLESEARKYLERHASQLEAAQPGIFKGATGEARIKMAQQQLRHEALQNGINVGLKAQVGSMVFALGGGGKQFADAWGQDQTDEQRTELKEKFGETGVMLGMQLALMGGAMGGATRMMYRGTPATVRAALQARAVNPYTIHRTVHDGQDLVFDAGGQIKSVTMKNEKVAKYKVDGDNVTFSTRGVIGNTDVTIKVPGKPKVTIKLSTNPSPLDTMQIVNLFNFASQFATLRGQDLAEAQKLFANADARTQMLSMVDQMIERAAKQRSGNVPAKSEWQALRKQVTAKFTEGVVP